MKQPLLHQKNSLSPTTPVVRFSFDRSDTLAAAARYLEQQARKLNEFETAQPYDALTGLLNDQGFGQVIEREVARCKRGLATGGLIALLEMDNYQAVERIHGVAAANAGLRLLSGSLKTEVRAMDVAARIGVDEFALLLSNTTKKRAASRMQLLMWRLNRLELAWQGQYVPVRVSLSLHDYERSKTAQILKRFGCRDGRGLAKEAQAAPSFEKTAIREAVLIE